jgi:hypothetical protein
MTDADIFSRVMAQYGGRLDRHRAAGTPAEQCYDEIEKLVAGVLVSSAREHVPNLPEIYFDYVYSGAVNAYAFKSEGRYFIGITTGAIYMIQLVFSRMLADSHLFEHIGNPGEEEDCLSPLTGYVPHAQQMAEAGLKPVHPRSAPRFSYSGYLFHQAILFLMGHEIAHISRGHVDYAASKTGTAMIAEATRHEEDQGQVFENQAMEADADMRTVASGCQSIELTLKTPNLDNPPWLPQRPDLGALLFDWAFAMNSFFRLFGDSRFNAPDLKTLTHPPPPLRRAIATANAYAFLSQNRHAVRQDAVLKPLRLAMKYSEFAFATILGENMSAEGLSDAYQPSGREHHILLMECWRGGLRDRIAPFAYERDADQSVDFPSEMPQ